MRVVTPAASELVPLLTSRGATVSTTTAGHLQVTDLTSARIGELAAGRGIPLHELTPSQASLEDAYLSLTRDAVQYRSESVPEGASA